ncbi:hypothetical protein SCHPADRAFT_904502 [Schizopora paradoxa]|uniref:Uncharacterized protein n=1 Tax=Schizopora paradoxa TaxID=27342 RepID=A0A0H2S8A0_9AGAM|nr:hypothetical protein SCHPADRAFT_904502 [Schizopora paradoxa]
MYANRQGQHAGDRVVIPSFAASQEAFNAYTAQHMHSLQRPPSVAQQNILASRKGSYPQASNYPPNVTYGGDPMRRSQSAASAQHMGMGVPGPGPSSQLQQQQQQAFSFGHPPPGWQPPAPPPYDMNAHNRMGNAMVPMHVDWSSVRRGIPPPGYGGAAQAPFGGQPNGNATMTEQADSDEPSVAPALGWWPDKPVPTLHWDLTSSQPPRYTKRPFSPDEFSKSPFSPPLERMSLILDEECSWAFEIRSPALSNAAFARRSSSGSSISGMGMSNSYVNHGGGDKYITLQSFFTDLSNLMLSRRVPISFWETATPAKRFRAARAMEKRTGRQIPSNAIVLPSMAASNAVNAALDAYVRMDSPGATWTGLQVSDLLGPEDVMFWGLALVHAPDQWMLRTAPSRSY